MSIPSPNQQQDASELRVIMVGALNKAIEVFCSHSEKTLPEVMANVMRPIAEAMDADNIYIDRMLGSNGKNRLERMYKWEKSGSKLKIEEGRFIIEDAAVAEWIATLRQ